MGAIDLNSGAMYRSQRSGGSMMCMSLSMMLNPFFAIVVLLLSPSPQPSPS